MKTLRFLFNFARTASLLIVLALIALLGLSYRNSELQKAIAEVKNMQEMQEEKSPDFEFEQSNEDHITFYTEKISLRSSSHRYYFLPDQIAYIENKKGDILVKLADSSSYPIDNTSYKKLWKELERRPGCHFFFTSNYTINCSYVTQSFSGNNVSYGSYYTYSSVLSTGDTIPIPKDKYPAFLSLMDSIAVSVK